MNLYLIVIIVAVVLLAIIIVNIIAKKHSMKEAGKPPDEMYPLF